MSGLGTTLRQSNMAMENPQVMAVMDQFPVKASITHVWLLEGHQIFGTLSDLLKVIFKAHHRRDLWEDGPASAVAGSQYQCHSAPMPRSFAKEMLGNPTSSPRGYLWISLFRHSLSNWESMIVVTTLLAMANIYRSFSSELKACWP